MRPPERSDRPVEPPKNFGIGAKLLLAFGGTFVLAIVIAATGWYGFEKIALSQRSVIGNAIPTMGQAQRLAEISAGVVASSGRLAESASDEDRAVINNFLSTQSHAMLSLAEELRKAGFETGDVEALNTVVNRMRNNLIEQNELVRRRLHLERRAAAISGELIQAADELTELSESLVANAASSATATTAGLYDLIDPGGGFAAEQAFNALDRLVEVDLDGMERMFELRLRSARVASFVAQLNREVRPEQIREIERNLEDNLGILKRRLADVNDPGRKAQATALLESVIASTSRNNPESLFSLRLEALETSQSIDDLVVRNVSLAEDLNVRVSQLVDLSGEMIDRSTARAEESLLSSRSTFIWSAVVAGSLALVTFWWFLQRSVVRRLDRLQSTTRAIAGGDLSPPKAIGGSDELTDMASALEVFRDNAITKQALERELREHQQHLEHLVSERTRQLEETNIQLAESVKQHAEARDRAERANRAKTTFLATMSHELRTPLSGMLGTTRLLEETCSGDGQHEYIHALRTAGGSLLNIVNDILDISKFESGGVRLEDRPFDVESMVLDLVALMKSPASAKSLALSYAIDPDIEPVVIGDEGRVRQILTNLLSNAIKFTDNGRVELGVELAGKADNDGIKLRFTVFDTGIGIPSDLLDNVFEPFTQVDASIARRHGGAGLGLAISRRLVTAMGGRLDVTSEHGEFTEFTVEIPFSVPSQPLPAAVAEGERLPSLEPVTVLVVEDDPVNRLVAKHYLERAGHTVWEATSGIEALALLAASEEIPRAVLMDIGLPGLDGLQTTRRLRGHEDPNLRRLPIIAMSAHVFPEEIDECLDAGMNCYLGKPFEPGQLVETLSRALNDETSYVTASMDDRGDLILDVDHLRQDFESLGAGAMGEIIELFMSSSRDCLAAFSEAISARSYAQAGAAAHRLKSAAASIGLDALWREASRVEKACAVGGDLTDQPGSLEVMVEKSALELMRQQSLVGCEATR